MEVGSLFSVAIALVPIVFGVVIRMLTLHGYMKEVRGDLGWRSDL